MNKEQLKVLLGDEKLGVLTCVRLALRFIDSEDIETTINRLMVDADKIRSINYELYEIVVDFPSCL